MRTVILFFLAVGLATALLAQTHSDTRTYFIATDDLNSFRLHNVKGDVNVRGVDGQQATLTVTRRLRSASRTRLESAKEDLTLDSMRLDGSLYFFVNAPDRFFKIDPDGKGQYESDWNDRSSRDRFEVEYAFEIELLVPKQLELWVSNHHSDLMIDNIQGDLYARNHHEDLAATNLGGNAKIINHHGDIEVSFTRNPDGECHFKTHHGTIRIAYQDDLDADVSLSSHHGEFFTAFDWQSVPVSASVDASQRGTRYVIKDRVVVRIGNGGPSHDFKTWHGDIYLTRN